MGAASKTKILQLPQWLGNEYLERLDMNTAFANIESACATVDALAKTYGYSVAVSGSTTTLTVNSTSPVTAVRKTVGSGVTGGMKYVVTVTIDGVAKTMTHIIANGESSSGAGEVVPFEALVNMDAQLVTAVKQINQTIGGEFTDMQADITATKADITALEGDVTALGNKLAQWWEYAKNVYDYVYTPPTQTATKPYTYKETLYEVGSTTNSLALLNTTVNADGSYTEVYGFVTDSGSIERTRTWTKQSNGQWKGVWS